MTTVQLARYDAMISAIDACHSVDEVKEYRDKAMALEAYARMALNAEAERRACEVRLRAERKCGELLKELRRGDAGRPQKIGATVAPISPYRAAIESSGLNERTAQRYQELASVSKEQFEDALSGPDKPSTNRIIMRAANGATTMDDGSLWLWGCVRDFEREGILKRSPEDIFGGMTDTMQADIHRILPALIDWLKSMERLTSPAPNAAPPSDPPASYGADG